MEDSSGLYPEWVCEKVRELIFTEGMTEAQARLWRFADSVRSGEMPSKDDLKALALCFEQILIGEDPKKALGLTGRQGQGRNRHAGVELYDKEISPVINIEIQRRKGLTLENALSLVSDEMGIARDSLARHHKRWRKLVVRQIQAQEENDELVDFMRERNQMSKNNIARMYTTLEKQNKDKGKG